MAAAKRTAPDKAVELRLSAADRAALERFAAALAELRKIDSVDNESGAMFDNRPSDMRRVSMSLAFSPSRHKRRREMNSINSWMRTKLGISMRRYARAKS